MDDVLSQCRWPKLPARYDRALREAVQFILARYHPVGIIASGTIIRGRPDATSDLDLYVLHRAPFRRRLQRFFAGVPAEVFVNPPAAVERYLAEERADGRPITAHMLATGFIILDRDPSVGELRRRAQECLADPPVLDPAALTVARYMAACLFEDALDVAGRDPATADMLVARAVGEMVHFAFRRAGRYLPRAKDLLDALAALDHELGSLARRFYGARTLQERLSLAGEIADGTIGVHGFFEWESAPDPVAD